MASENMSDIDKILGDIEDSILKAEASYQLWWGLAHHGKNDYKDAINITEYVDFFHASIPLLLQGIFVNLSKVYDRGSDLSGIRMLKEHLENNNLPDLSSYIDTALKPHECSIKSIKGIRNHSVAHNKHEKSVCEIYQENPIKPDEIKTIIFVTKDIIVKVSDVIGRESNVLLSDRYCNATISLLKTLRCNKT